MISAAQAKVSIDQLQINSIGSEYTGSVQAYPPSNSAQLLFPAVTASSNRLHTLELLLASGAVIGLVLGLALATAREYRRPSLR